jgi:hypothetical protein
VRNLAPSRDAENRRKIWVKDSASLSRIAECVDSPRLVVPPFFDLTQGIQVPSPVESLSIFSDFPAWPPLLRGEGWGEVNKPLPLLVRKPCGTYVSYKVDAGASVRHLTSILCAPGKPARCSE